MFGLDPNLGVSSTSASQARAQTGELTGAELNALVQILGRNPGPSVNIQQLQALATYSTRGGDHSSCPRDPFNFRHNRESMFYGFHL